MSSNLTSSTRVKPTIESEWSYLVGFGRRGGSAKNLDKWDQESKGFSEPCRRRLQHPCSCIAKESWLLVPAYNIQSQSQLALELRERAPRAKYLSRSKSPNVQSRNFSSFNRSRDELSIEEEAERKIGWLLKFFFAGTATFVAYQFFPYMGDNLVQQSISLLQVKDPFFKRTGASRLARFAVDDERRKKIVELGGAQELVNMLEDAKEDSTRISALKALAALSHSDEAVEHCTMLGLFQ
ncbi:hypothetical protein GH714_013779 [Hevea brasiliensis]|uniref:Armadillo repeat-containing domain-containing protein n=1 Tax=Hevea brasiliensis TaxID=3981 RepID=A0A6A6N4T3_HEVBR|nr:hypothetical protein GH714_013779 [Hevea brasiliensis]